MNNCHEHNRLDMFHYVTKPHHTVYIISALIHVHRLQKG